MANQDVTLSREEADLIIGTLQRVRNSIHKMNPSLGRQCDKALQMMADDDRASSKEEPTNLDPVQPEPDTPTEPGPKAIQDS